jgi:hypothetical protein
MRIDKYDPVDGGFRAPLAADQDATPGQVGDADAAIGVGLDVNGRVVAGEGNTGVLGALVLTRNMKAGDIVDVMTDGELVEFGGDAGTIYHVVDATGVIDDGAPAAGQTRLGHTVEGNRLVVRVRR